MGLGIRQWLLRVKLFRSHYRTNLVLSLWIENLLYVNSDPKLCLAYRLSTMREREFLCTDTDIAFTHTALYMFHFLHFITWNNLPLHRIIPLSDEDSRFMVKTVSIKLFHPSCSFSFYCNLYWMADSSTGIHDGARYPRSPVWRKPGISSFLWVLSRVQRLLSAER